MKIITLEEIKSKFNYQKMLLEIAKSFEFFSENNIICAPILQYHFPKNLGELHIKSGHLINDKYFFIKIATGFSNNQNLGLDNCQGTIICLNANTGKPEIILNDEGYITNMRTALAGTLSAKLFSSPLIHSVGIMGTGIQAYLNAEYLINEFPLLKNLYIYGRNFSKLEKIKPKFEKLGYNVILCATPNEVLENCNLIITVTSATTPYIFPDKIQRGSVIIAIGADDGVKQELDCSVLEHASSIFTDSLEQCLKFGELSHSKDLKLSMKNKVYELGNFISGKIVDYSRDKYIVVDLTGLAAQDIMISKYILQNI